MQKKLVTKKRTIFSNKLVKWGGSLAILTGIVVGITIPAVKASKNSDYVVTKGIDAKTSIVDGIETKSLIDYLKKDTKVESNEYIKNAENFSYDFLYEDEQKGSIEYQKQTFKWEIYLKNRDIVAKKVEIVNRKKDATFVKQKEEEIAKLVEKRKEIENKVTQLKANNIDWNNNSINSDFPELLRPLHNDKNGNLIQGSVWAQKQKIFNDEKKNFIEGYVDKKGGEENWPDKRKTSYGNAATDEEAIQFLVTNEIKTKANTRFEFSLNSTFTIEKLESGAFDQFLGIGMFKENGKTYMTRSYFFSKYGLIETGSNLKWVDLLEVKNLNNIKDTIANKETYLKKDTKFFVLTDANQDVKRVTDFSGYESQAKKLSFKKDEISLSTKNTLNDKVYFFGNKSKNSKNIVLKDEKTRSTLFNSIAKKKLFNIQHALIAAIPDESGSELPWKIEKTDTIKNLLAFLPDNKRVYDKYYDKVFIDKNSKDKKITDTYLRRWSDNSEGTKKKNGFLGFNSLEGHFKAFNNGFALGLLSILNPDNPKTPGKSDFLTNNAKEGLFDKLNIALNQQANLYNVGTKNASGKYEINNNRQLAQLIDEKIKKDNLTKVFGAIFRDFFKGKKNKLHYKLNDNRYIVISKNGMHLIKIGEEKTTKENVIEELKKDLTKVAEKDNTGESELSSNGNFKIVNDIYSKTESKLNYLIADPNFEKFLNKKEIQKKINNYKFSTLKEVIATNLKSSQIALINDTLSSKKIVSWYIEAIDKKLRDGNSITQPENIYELLNKLTQDTTNINFKGSKKW